MIRLQQAIDDVRAQHPLSDDDRGHFLFAVVDSAGRYREVHGLLRDAALWSQQNLLALVLEPAAKQLLAFLNEVTCEAQNVISILPTGFVFTTLVSAGQRVPYVSDHIRVRVPIFSIICRGRVTNVIVGAAAADVIPVTITLEDVTPWR